MILRSLSVLAVGSLVLAASGCSSSSSNSGSTAVASTAVAASPVAPTTAAPTTAAPTTAAPTTAAPTTAAATTAAPTTAATDAPTTVVNTTELPTTTTAPEADPLVILVTNDDGIGAPGIDALAVALAALPDVEIVVVAPAENQSGSSDTTTPGGVTHADGATNSGIAGIAVAGTPADSVIVALDELGIVPDLVVSGVNSVQNIGTFVSLSGTVGAARTASRRGIPAIAVSSGPIDAPDYVASARVAAEEVTAHRAEFGPSANTDRTVVNLNVPSCAPGTSLRGVVDVVTATVFPEGTDGINMTPDCASTATDPADDASAMLIGFAARSIVPADL